MKDRKCENGSYNRQGKGSVWEITMTMNFWNLEF